MEPPAHRAGQWIPTSYSPREWAAIYDVNRRLGAIMDGLPPRLLRAGADVADIDAWLHGAALDVGAYPSMLGFRGTFPTASAVSVNDQVCHAPAVAGRPRLRRGDIVKVDMCLYAGGFHSDQADCWVVGGAPDPDRLRTTAYDALEAAVRICRPGVRYKEIAAAVTRVARHHGLHVVRGFGGHGIGRYIHMLPHVHNSPDVENPYIMREGHVFTIEPILSAGAAYTRTDTRDGLTILTADGGRASHVERVVQITAGGCRLLQAV